MNKLKYSLILILFSTSIYSQSYNGLLELENTDTTILLIESKLNISPGDEKKWYSSLELQTLNLDDKHQIWRFSHTGNTESFQLQEFTSKFPSPKISMTKNGRIGFGTPNPTADFEFSKNSVPGRLKLRNVGGHKGLLIDPLFIPKILNEQYGFLEFGVDNSVVARINPLGDLETFEFFISEGFRIEESQIKWEITTGYRACGDGGILGPSFTAGPILAFRNSDFGTVASLDNDGSFCNISDARRKKDVTPLKSMSNKVAQLNPVKYQYLNQEDSNPYSKGFIAQEVEEIFPELVNGDNPEDMKTLKYKGFGVLAIKVAQEQQIILEAYLDQLEVLEAKLEKLKK